MGWSGWPPTAGTDIQAYSFLIQAWKALAEKKKARGLALWPEPGDLTVWDSGNTTLATDNGDNTIDFAMATTAAWTPGSGCSSPRWVSYICTACELGWMPENYDLIVWADLTDPRTAVRMPITAEVVDGTSGTLTVQADAAHNAVTAKFISSLSDLAGKPYWITKRFAPFTSDRIPDYPNDPHLWEGSGTAADGYWPPDDTTDPMTHVVTHGTLYTVLTDADATTSWGTDQWAGKQLMVITGGTLLRLAIVHNAGKSLYVAHQATAPGGNYYIVDSSAKIMLGRAGWMPYLWYAGGNDQQATHGPNDDLVLANVPKANQVWQVGDPCVIGGECVDESHGVFDIDAHYPKDTEEGANCVGGLAGDLVNPNLFKSLRGLQNEIIAEATSGWVPHKDYTDSGAINVFTPAGLFYKASINAGDSTTQYMAASGSVPAYFYFPVDDPYVGCGIYYEVLDTRGRVKTSGYLAADADGFVNNVPDLGYTDDTHNDSGLTVHYSAGWTRVRPRWFKYLYPKTCFMPEVDGDTGEPIVPPTVTTDELGHYDCEGKGTWISRPASTGGVVTSTNGVRIDSAEPFVTGKKYLCIGDNQNDPFPGGDLSDPLTVFYDKFYRGKLNKINQVNRDGSRGGTASTATKYCLTDSTKNWGSDWANSGTLRTESGTATDGGTTFLTDASKDTTDASLPHSCWFASDRYAGSPYADFILEVTHAGVTTKVPITSTSNGAGGVTINFAAVDSFTVHIGDTWQIKEPQFELNKWKGRLLSITKTDGTLMDPITITHSDNTTLFFDPQASTIPAGSSYRIIEDPFGAVYEWDGTQMVPFAKDQQFAVNEDYVTDYGPVHKDDLITIAIFSEVKKALDAIRSLGFDFAWTSRAIEATPENNVGGIGEWDQTDGPNFYATDADKAIVTSDPGDYFYAPDLPVYSDTKWEQNYSCNEDVYVCEGQREQMYDIYLSTDGPSLSEDRSAVPQKTFETVGFMYGNHGSSPDGGALNQPWMEIEVGDFRVGPAVAAYAYGKITGVPTMLSSSVDMYVYWTIDTDDHDQGHKVVAAATGDYGDNSWDDTTYTFDAGGNSGAQYRKWTKYATLTPDGSGNAIGPKAGENDDFLSLTGTFVNCDEGAGHGCHLVSDYPTTFTPPDGSAGQVAAMDHTLGTSYRWSKTEYKGYVAKDKFAVINFSMDFNDGT